MLIPFENFLSLSVFPPSLLTHINAVGQITQSATLLLHCQMEVIAVRMSGDCGLNSRDIISSCFSDTRCMLSQCLAHCGLSLTVFASRIEKAKSIIHQLTDEMGKIRTTWTLLYHCMPILNMLFVCLGKQIYLVMNFLHLSFKNRTD